MNRQRSEHALPGVVLAAGQGTRFQGGYKLLMPFRGHAIIYHAVKAMVDAQLDPILMVLGFEHENLLKAVDELRDHHKLQIVHNERWQTGRASSVRVALEHLPKDAPGVLFLPGDMPLMTSALIDRVTQHFLQTGKLCFPLCRGQKGHPTVFPGGLLTKLQELPGDLSGLTVVKAHWDEAEKLLLADKEEITQLDLDTDADYARLKTLDTMSYEIRKFDG